MKYSTLSPSKRCSAGVASSSSRRRAPVCGKTYGDVADLSEMLRSALEHPDMNRKMVEAGRRYIKEHLAWERIVKQLEAMYESCVRHVWVSPIYNQWCWSLCILSYLQKGIGLFSNT